MRAAQHVPSPLAGEGGERGSDSAREPGEGFFSGDLSGPLTRLASLGTLSRKGRG